MPGAVTASEGCKASGVVGSRRPDRCELSVWAVRPLGLVESCRSQGRRVPRIQAGDLKQDTWVHCGCKFEEVGSDANAMGCAGVLEVLRFAWTCVTQAGFHCRLWAKVRLQSLGERVRLMDWCLTMAVRGHHPELPGEPEWFRLSPPYIEGPGGQAVP